MYMYMYSRGQKKVNTSFLLHGTKGHETKMKQKRNDKTEARNEMEIVKDETETSACAARDCANRAIAVCEKSRKTLLLSLSIN